MRKGFDDWTYLVDEENTLLNYTLSSSWACVITIEKDAANTIVNVKHSSCCPVALIMYNRNRSRKSRVKCASDDDAGEKTHSVRQQIQLKTYTWGFYIMPYPYIFVPK